MNHAHAQHPRRAYKYFDLVMAAFVTVLLCANLIGPAKIATLWGFTFGAGVLFFPISYIFGDVLTEVYGYAKARKVVWTGFAALVFASFMCWAVVSFPPAPGWQDQQAYETIYGQVPRIVLASLIAFWAGELANSYVLAKMKVFMEGRRLWMRTIGSTIVGEGVDSMIFYTVAFYGLWTTDQLLLVMSSNYLIKVGWEVLATPVTYRIVGWLKRAEHEDYFDRDTDFNPFVVRP
ncbi:MAG: queuosine precursor transporter [Rhodocyclaceae bacterium]